MSRKPSRTTGPEKPRTRQRDTVADVARAAGVSIATVSRVFSGATPVAEKTRKRVLDAAQKIGFRPNVAARALRTGKMETVAFALHAPHLMGEFYSEMMAGFHSVFLPRRLRVILAVAPLDTDPNDWLRELVYAGWCGALAIHVMLANDLEFIKSLGIPVTLAGHYPATEERPAGISTVGFDSRIGVVQAIRHLVALGHRRIACLTGTRGSEDAEYRVEGFRQGLAEAGLGVQESWIVPCTFEEGPKAGAAGMDQLLSGGRKRPTAVVCGSDNIALGAISSARRWGLHVPEDLSVVGFDDFLWAASYNPPLTTVEHKGWDLGVAVGNALLAQYEDPASPPQTIILPTRLVVRESTAAPKSGG